MSCPVIAPDLLEKIKWRRDYLLKQLDRHLNANDGETADRMHVSMKEVEHIIAMCEAYEYKRERL